MDEIITIYKEEKFKIEQFLKRLVNFFQDNPDLHKEPLPVVHSVKYRMKNEQHLADKVERKKSLGVELTKDNLFEEITDLAGIRVLHLYSEQLKDIHNAIMQEVNNGDLVLYETPKALLIVK